MMHGIGIGIRQSCYGKVNVKKWKIQRLFLVFFLWTLYTTSFDVNASETEEKPIVVLIPSYNNKNWYEYNLTSALAQQYSNFRVIYIDDASTDGTGALVDAYIKEKDQQQRVTVLHNSQRLGALCNTYRGVWMCRPDEIVAILDGDDWFAHPYVLRTLNEVYTDPEVWTTYGQFLYYPSGHIGWARKLPEEIISQNQVRYYDWVTTHLRTFYARLFQKIRVEDLLYNQHFFSSAGDLAYTWPIMEMAGHHSRFIPDVLYVYNVASQLNDHKVAADLQVYFTYVIRDKKPYQPIESLY